MLECEQIPAQTAITELSGASVILLTMGAEGILRRQAGVIGRAQAHAAGMSQAAISARVARGMWRSLYPAVYLASDHELTDEARLRAAVLWAGTEGTAHGVAAAWWLGLWPALPEVIAITVPRRRYLPSRAGLRVRRRDRELAADGGHHQLRRLPQAC